MDNEISNNNYVRILDLSKPFKINYDGVMNCLHYLHLVELKKRMIEQGVEVSDEFNAALKIDYESLCSFFDYLTLASADKRLRELAEEESEK